MRKYVKKSPLSFTKVLELIGKPSFFLFTIVIVGFAGYLHLLRHFTQQVLRLGSDLKGRAQPRRHKSGEGQTLKVFKLNRKLIFSLLVCLTVSLLFYYFIFRDLPSVTLLSDSPPSLTTKIYDRNDQLLYQIYKDENRTLVKLSDLPKHLIDATLAAEDKNFYHHFGIDPVGILRATYNNLIGCNQKIGTCTLQGGSTITQQLIKNTLLTPERTFTRKLKELVLALSTEAVYSKDEILQMYLNQVGYGGTAYGVEQASWQYFGKSARDLSLSESAMLAGLPISPTILSPFSTSPYLGKVRQQQVLESMVARQMISENDKLEALDTPLIFHPQGVEIRAPHFVMYIKDLLVKEFGEDMVARGGLEVTTTLDLKSQDILQNQINSELTKLSSLHVQNGAGLVIAPKSGEILAMVGSRDFFDPKIDGQVNLVLQPRQPGSAIKPITYALALSSGATPSTIIDDAPVCFVLPGQSDYCPKNYDGRFHGRVTLRTALASSYNIPAIKLLNTYGLEGMITLAKRLGITTWDDSSRFGLSLTLGGGEITMLDLASVYSVFASGGLKVPFKSILSVRGPTGSDLEGSAQPPLDPRGVSLTGDTRESRVGTPKVEGDSPQYAQVLSPGVAYQISSILSDQSARAPAFGWNSILNLPGKFVAVKTGTTNNLRDNWTFGYTSDLLVATWVGNNDNSPMSSVASGITGASPIWARTMQALLTDNPATAFVPPKSMVKLNVSCSPTPRYEYFVKGTTTRINCSPSPSPGTLLDSAASTSQ